VSATPWGERSPAECPLDECAPQDDCDTCAGPNGDPNGCTEAGQECVEGSLTALSDWECRCLLPSTGSKTAGAVESCIFDECDANREICTAEMQICFDPNPIQSKLGDWECQRPPPSDNKAHSL